MKKVIYKFRLAPGATISLPGLGHLLPRHAAEQLGQPCAWIELDADEVRHDFDVVRLETGQPLPAGAHVLYLGTTLESHGMYVWHWFAVREHPARRAAE